MGKRKKINFLFLIISLVIVVAILIKVFYPIVQGELQTDQDAVYLSTLDPVYDYDGGIVSFSPNKQATGINIRLANGNVSGYQVPSFKATYKIHSKFDRLTGTIVLLKNKNLNGKLINVLITADKDKVIYNTMWDVSKKSKIPIDISLDKVRMIEIYFEASQSTKGEILNIGLSNLAVTKGNAKPTLVAKKPSKKLFSFDLRSILLLPKRINNKEDSSYIKLFNIKHSMNYVNLANNSEIFSTDFHGEMSFYLLNGNKNDPLSLKSKYIKMSGATYEPNLKINNEYVLTNIIPTDTKMSIFIPKGTVISRDGYTLKQDYIIKNITIVNSMWEGVVKSIKRYLPTILLFGGSLLLFIILGMFLGKKSETFLPIDACVINITISFLLCIVVFGIPGMLANSFLRSGYQNDIGLLILISFYVIPCATIILYRILMTWRFNIKSFGIVKGTFAFMIEIILTVSCVYLIGMIFGGVLFGSIAVVKDIMDD